MQFIFKHALDNLNYIDLLRFQSLNAWGIFYIVCDEQIIKTMKVKLGMNSLFLFQRM